MPRRRKSKEEWAADALESEPDDTGVIEGEFQAFDPGVGSEVNELFQFLHANDWMTTGQYTVTTDVDSPTVVTLSVLLREGDDR